MPKLDTQLHLNMYGDWKKNRHPIARVLNFLGITKPISEMPEIYGYEWGNPETIPSLKHIKDYFILPYVSDSQTALEIGPGGGRWTKYLQGFKKLYAVDYHSELLLELKKNYNQPNMVFVKNNGTDFPGLKDNSIDFLFSFGTFVHLDLDIIEKYLSNIHLILRSTGNAVIQYSDKTKSEAQKNETFSNNTPEEMRKLVLRNNFKILEEDTTTLPHSSIIRFSK